MCCLFVAYVVTYKAASPGRVLRLSQKRCDSGKRMPWKDLQFGCQAYFQLLKVLGRGPGTPPPAHVVRLLFVSQSSGMHGVGGLGKKGPALHQCPYDLSKQNVGSTSSSAIPSLAPFISLYYSIFRFENILPTKSSSLVLSLPLTFSSTTTIDLS